MLHVLICNDNPNQGGIIKAALHQISRKLQINVQVEWVRSLEQLDDYLAKYGDLVELMVIESVIQGVDGINIASRLSERMPAAKFLFISQYAEHVFQSFKVKHDGYLLFPIDEKVLEIVLKRIYADLAASKSKYVVLTRSGLISRICLDDIYYLESNLHTVRIHTRQGTQDFHEKLVSIQPMLDYRFLPCHKSFIVNLSFVTAMKTTHFILDTGVVIPISSRRYKESKESYDAYISQFHHELPSK
ncbi:MAG: response regulator transcription factor [Clostridiaceae bacterium]|nr:response regulator transcription factor [Clostridiaceae bacterium]